LKSYIFPSIGSKNPSEATAAKVVDKSGEEGKKFLELVNPPSLRK